jgi:hypothetical protein
MGRFATVKKIGSKIWGGENMVEKKGSGSFFVIKKEKRQPLFF